MRIQVRASSQQKVWNEAENRERDWGETLSACEARARKTLTPRFTDFFTDFEKKTDCFAVYGSLYDVSFIFDLPYWKLQLLNCALLKLFRTLVGGLPAEDFQGGLNLTYDIQMADNDTR